MKSIITDASYNTIGLTTGTSSELIIFTKHYIDLDGFATSEISIADYSKSKFICRNCYNKRFY